MSIFNFPDNPQPPFDVEDNDLIAPYGVSIPTAYLQTWSEFEVLTVHEVVALSFGLNPNICLDKDQWLPDGICGGSLNRQVWNSRWDQVKRAIVANKIKAITPCLTLKEVNGDTLVRAESVENYFKQKSGQNPETPERQIPPIQMFQGTHSDLAERMKVSSQQFIKSATWELIKVKAESKRLPDMLLLTEIGYLLGHDPIAFEMFMKDEQIALQKQGNRYGVTKDDFKAYRQRIHQWPVKDCLLANWWTDQEKIQESNPELTKSERESLLKLIIGMAIDSYGYDPETEKKQKATGTKAGSIRASLATRGIDMDEQTIKKYLDEAKAKQLHTHITQQKRQTKPIG